MSLAEVVRELVECRACPRLVAWRERVASEKRAAYRDQDYWGRPVPGFGDPAAQCVIVGLAPAAHGANRTGRMFTGDRSGDWLYRALFRAGFASQPGATGRDDGLTLHNAYVTSIVHCAPPGNRPTTEERDRCGGWVRRELDCVGPPRVIVSLGALSFGQVLRLLAEAGAPLPRPRPRFAHGVEVAPGPGYPTVIGSYHPSQQNTFTGRLTEAMFDQIFERARVLAG